MVVFQNNMKINYFFSIDHVNIGLARCQAIEPQMTNIAEALQYIQ